MKPKVTMQKIADQLGVSKYVVSKALAGKKGVSPLTRERVLTLAAQLGYLAGRPYPQGGAEGDTEGSGSEAAKYNVIVLMPGIRFQTRESAYWGRILEGISEELQSRGIGMIILTDNTIEQLVSILKPQGLMGLIGVGFIATPLLLEVHRLGIPIVLIDHEDPLVPADTVFANNYDAMLRLTDYLIGLGHRDIRFFGEPDYARSFRERWRGFRDQMGERGLLASGGLAAVPIEEPDELRRALGGAFPTALVCVNDERAMVASRVIRDAGLSVPGDVSVTGFDDIPESIEYGLTTVRVEKEYLGARAVEMLQRRRGRFGTPAEQLLVSGRLAIRDSTAKPRSKREAVRPRQRNGV